MLCKVLACEIMLREVCFLAATSPLLLDLEFLPQGYHDNPAHGRSQVQARVDAVPAGKYDALLLGYGLCGNLIAGLQARHTRLIVPRAHDCITFFLGSRQRYEQQQQERPGAYYYTCGWLECMARRGQRALPQGVNLLPNRPGPVAEGSDTYAAWVEKYGEEAAQYLVDAMNEWLSHYTHGILIDYDFTRVLNLRAQVQEICQKRGWTFEELAGDLTLLRRWLHGEWAGEDFLEVPPGARIEPSYDAAVIRATMAP